MSKITCHRAASNSTAQLVINPSQPAYSAAHRALSTDIHTLLVDNFYLPRRTPASYTKPPIKTILRVVFGEEISGSGIQVLRQKFHKLKRASTVDHLVDPLTLTARHFFDQALRRGPDGFVCPMDTCRKEQHESGVSEVHGKTQKISDAVYRLFPFPYQRESPTKWHLEKSIFRLPRKRIRAKRMGKGQKGMGTQG